MTKFEVGEVCRTRARHEAKVIYTSANNEKPIIALVRDPKTKLEHPHAYHENGRKSLNGESSDDLLPELARFWIGICLVENHVLAAETFPTRDEALAWESTRRQTKCYNASTDILLKPGEFTTASFTVSIPEKNHE